MEDVGRAKGGGRAEEGRRVHVELWILESLQCEGAADGTTLEVGHIEDGPWSQLTPAATVASVTDSYALQQYVESSGLEIAIMQGG